MSWNINVYSSFNFKIKLQYLDSSIIMEYGDFVKLSSSNVCDF
jgi:hypothetical protein